MGEFVRLFYDELADDYHLLFADWEASIQRQAGVLDRIISMAIGSGPHSVLDCASGIGTSGIGTQTIGLAQLGHRVYATDLSPNAVSRLQREIKSRGLTVTRGIADLRSLAEEVSGSFDVVLACDNALPHLPNLDDLAKAVEQMATKLRSCGLFVISVRDYDRLRIDFPRTEGRRVLDGPDGRRITFQVWEWAADGNSYRLQQFIVRQSDGGWRTDCFEVEYQAFGRQVLEQAARNAGMNDVRWLEPEESGFYQPILTARKPDAD